MENKACCFFFFKPTCRRWLLSAVSATGTSEALKFIKNRIRNDDLNYIQALLSVSFALHLTKADEQTVPIAAVSKSLGIFAVW